MKNYHIMMGDVVASSKRNQIELQQQLKRLVGAANSKLKNKVLSPYTITLGDEFQGVATSLSSIVDALFYFEEEILRRKYSFKLHFVAHFGAITTRINPSVAYEMLGPGLSRARTELTRKRRERPRFTFLYGDSGASSVLEDLFYPIEEIIDRWKERDFALILELLASESDSKVGAKLQKDRTLIWKRRRSLRIDEYVRLKRAILKIAQMLD